MQTPPRPPKTAAAQGQGFDFVALAAHELRAPLTELRGYLDLLQHELTDLSPAQQDYLNRSIINSTRMGTLINNLLNVARIEHGELNYLAAPMDYREFILDLANELETRARTENRRFKLELPAELPGIQADSMGLREVIINLANNAITYTEPESGQITLTVTLDGGGVETTVSDNGAGIPAEAMDSLFTKFYRVPGTKPDAHGTGLGLFICKAIIEAHGGRIWAESVQGRGSTFSFRLPLTNTTSKEKTP